MLPTRRAGRTDAGPPARSASGVRACPRGSRRCVRRAPRSRPRRWHPTGARGPRASRPPGSRPGRTGPRGFRRTSRPGSCRRTSRSARPSRRCRVDSCTEDYTITRKRQARVGTLLGDALDAAEPGCKDGRRPSLAPDRSLMDHTESVTPTPVAGILGVVGGALLALGSFLTWAEVTGGGTSVTAKGVDGSDGYITLVAGLVAVVAGIMMARGTRRVLAVLVILAGIVGGGIGLYDALTAKDSVLDAAAE